MTDASPPQQPDPNAMTPAEELDDFKEWAVEPLSRTDPPRCDECGRVGYIVGVGADLRIGGHLDQRVKHPFRSGTEPGE